MLTCTRKEKYTKNTHTHTLKMEVLWQQALELESMLGHSGGGRWGMPLWSLFGVWWSWWTDNTGHMKHKDSEEMLSGVTLLEVYSHIHTVMKEKSKRKKRIKEEVEDEMRILQQLLEKWRQSGGGKKWLWMANPIRGGIYERTGHMMDSYEYCMNTGKQLNEGHGEGAAKKTRFSWWLLI